MAHLVALKNLNVWGMLGTRLRKLKADMMGTRLRKHRGKKLKKGKGIGWKRKTN